jgi:DNA repair photolyase
MIISASRRTDIPNYHTDWFYSQIKKGYFEVQNPYYKEKINKYDINPGNVDCFVFWTKNPDEKFIKKLNKFNYKYYFQFSITAYDKDIEPNTNNKTEIIEKFKEISFISDRKVIWRYDPILLSEKYNLEYHIKAFQKLCSILYEYTDRCVISFVDVYQHLRKKFSNLGIREPDIEEIEYIANAFSMIADDYGIKIQSCSEKVDLTKYGIINGACIDKDYIESIIGKPLDIKEDKGQRKLCKCVKSIDIGSYSTCKNNCLYCYASK